MFTKLLIFLAFVFTVIGQEFPINLTVSSNSSPVVIQLTNLESSVYLAYVNGYVTNKVSLERTWLPTPMFFATTNSGENGFLLLKQGLTNRMMQGFGFHARSNASEQLTFRLHSNAVETVFITSILVTNKLLGVTNAAIKVEQRLFTGSNSTLPTLTAERQTRDDLIWNALPPLNHHLQVHSDIARFSTKLEGYGLGAWQMMTLTNLDNPQYIYNHPFEALDFVNEDNGAVFWASNVLSFAVMPDGQQGWFHYGDTNLYFDVVPYILGSRYLYYYKGIALDPNGGGLHLAYDYATAGNAENAHDAAIALVRWAYDWPALELTHHEFRVNTHSPDYDYAPADWSDPSVRFGKMYYRGWSGTTAKTLFDAYDQLFPYIYTNQVFADAVNRFLPEISTPEDVVRFLDRNLVWKSVMDSRIDLIDASAGVEDYAARLLGPSTNTETMFDLTQQPYMIHPWQTPAPYQEAYATVFDRNGVYYSGSQGYSIGNAYEQMVKVAAFHEARGIIPLPMDISDLNRYTKMEKVINFPIDMFLAGGFNFGIGDSSGGPHTGPVAGSLLAANAASLRDGFTVSTNSRVGWVLKNIVGDSSALLTAATAGVSNPILYNTSRVIPGWGAIIEAEPSEPTLTNKTTLAMRLGWGTGHMHADALDIAIYGYGVPATTDFAARNEGSTYWTRPAASSAFLHNRAFHTAGFNTQVDGAQLGDAYLHYWAPPLIGGTYVDQYGYTVQRETILMEVGDNTGRYYAFDVQRVTSDWPNHVWAFHGVESSMTGLVANVEMTARDVADHPSFSRFLTNTCYTGVTSNHTILTWEMSRATNATEQNFDALGPVNTVNAESAVLGTNYNPAQATFKTRAHLLTRTGDDLFQANPYSRQYAYCFPVAYVAATNHGGVSVFPAIYEWYRETPVVTNVSVLATNPMTVRVWCYNGQVDTYEWATNYCKTWSTNAAGALRWSHSVSNTSPATIASINYTNRALTATATLGTNPAVQIGNAYRKIYLELTGSGTNYTFADDLLVCEGEISSVSIDAGTNLTIEASQTVLEPTFGNRGANGFTVTPESGAYQFRAGQLVAGPTATATTNIFTDVNGDGKLNVKTYEIGTGDTVTLFTTSAAAAAPEPDPPTTSGVMRIYSY